MIAGKYALIKQYFSIVRTIAPNVSQRARAGLEDGDVNLNLTAHRIVGIYDTAEEANLACLEHGNSCYLVMKIGQEGIPVEPARWWDGLPT